MPCDTLAPGRLKPKERPARHIQKKLRAIREIRGAKTVEHFQRQPAGIRLRF